VAGSLPFCLPIILFLQHTSCVCFIISSLPTFTQKRQSRSKQRQLFQLKPWWKWRDFCKLTWQAHLQQLTAPSQNLYVRLEMPSTTHELLQRGFTILHYNAQTRRSHKATSGPRNITAARLRTLRDIHLPTYRCRLTRTALTFTESVVFLIPGLTLRKKRIGKGKAFPLQPWTGPWGSRRTRLQNF
jgi:hypothetical protein